MILGEVELEVITRNVLIFSDKNGYEPYTDWIDNLKDKQNQQRIKARVRRLEQGNFGDHRPVGDNVSELRFFFGSGFRVYYAEDGEKIVLLLCGGDKQSQEKDIESAKTYWKEYQNDNE